MATSITSIDKKEYARLKRIDSSFGKLFDYFVELYETAEARKQIKEKKTVPQDKLFKKLGI